MILLDSTKVRVVFGLPLHSQNPYLGSILKGFNAHT